MKPGSSGRFGISRTGVSPILTCLKNWAVVFIKESQVCPQHCDRLTTDTLGSNEWVVPGPHTFTQQKWFVDVLKQQALVVGTARKSLRWESIATQSIAGVVQIEHLLRQWRSQVPKRFLLSNTVANPFLTHSRSKVSYQWLLQELFEKKYAWVAAFNP